MQLGSVGSVNGLITNYLAKLRPTMILTSIIFPIQALRLHWLHNAREEYFLLGKYLLIRRWDTLLSLKGQCHEIFELYFFSLIKPIWAPDKQAKMVFLKNSFSRRYSNLKFFEFDSAQANTAQSRNFSTSQPFKKLTKKCWALLQQFIYIFCFI